MSPLPYAQIPRPPTEWSAGTAISRVVDGLGFRYHWATEGLTPADLDYSPGETNRTIGETLLHIHALVEMVRTGLEGERYTNPKTADDLEFETLRAETLEAVGGLSRRVAAMGTVELGEAKLRFGGARDYDFPLWHALNGPIADALYHVGQVVGYRRAAGNPMDENVNVFLGRRKT